jgi:hypothetical protein
MCSTKSGRQASSQPGNEKRGNAASPSCHHRDQTVACWPGYRDGPSRLAFSRDGKWLVTGGWIKIPHDAAYHVWNMKELIPLLRKSDP